MSLVSDTIPNLVNGVSQQAPSIRLASQCEAQENLYSSLVENLKTRSPSKHIKKLLSYDSTFTREKVLNSASHIVNRDINERYIVSIVDDQIKVFTLDGEEKSVATPDGTGYLPAVDQTNNLRAITVKDHTFIVNREVEVAMDSTIYDTVANEGMIFVKQASYDTKQYVELDGYEVKAETDTQGYHDDNHLTGPDGNGTDQDPVAIDTVFLAQCLAEDLKANHPNISDYNITYYKSVIYITRVDGGTFDLSSRDSRSDSTIDTIKDKVTRISKLPLTAPDGFYIQIEEDDTNDWDNYYVKFVANDTGEFTEGIWRETNKYGIETKLDASTMPHVLVRESDGNFTFKHAEWADREAGDEYTSPDPSFIGHTINDVFLAKNRLAFTSDIYFVTSQAQDLFNFFVSTATTKVDNDPIDTTPPDAEVSPLNHAISTEDGIIFFSDQKQFVLEYPEGEAFSNKTADIEPLSKFESSSKARPVIAGDMVFFPTDNGDFSGMQEHYSARENTNTRPSEITAPIPSYIPKGITKIASNKTTDILIDYTPNTPRTLYVYKYYWSNNEKVQSAWSKYGLYKDTNSEILNISFVNTDLYITVAHEDGLYLEVMDLSTAATDTGFDYQIHLDRRVDESQCSNLTYDSDTDRTTITLPYDITGELIEDWRMVLRSNHGDLLKGFTPKIFSIVGNVIEVEGDLTGAEFYFGNLYEQTYTFSHQFIRTQASGGGYNVIRNGRLQMRTWQLAFDKTGSFTVEVTPKGGTTYKYVYTGNIIGTETASIGSNELSGGIFEFTVGAKNDEVDITIKSKSHLPVGFINAEWIGFFNSHSQRVS